MPLSALRKSPAPHHVGAEVQDQSKIEELLTQCHDSISFIRGHVVQAVKNERGNWGTALPPLFWFERSSPLSLISLASLVPSLCIQQR